MPTDWGAIDFRKLYMPHSVEFEQLPYVARAIGGDMIRRCDRKGQIVPCDGCDGCDVTLVTRLKFHLRAHEGEETAIEQATRCLLRDGYLVFKDGWLTVRNYIEAQRSRSADRMAKKRERDGRYRRDVSDVTSGEICNSVTMTIRGEEKEDKDLPPTPQGGPGAVPGILDIASRGYAAGIRAITKGLWTFPADDSERESLRDLVEMHAPGLKGDRLEAKMTTVASTYCEARRDSAQYERGFRPSKCVDWYNAGRPGERTTTARPATDIAAARTNRVQEEALRKAGSQ